MSEPTTQAGRDLDHGWPGSHLDRLQWHDAILAIEREAREQAEQERNEAEAGATALALDVSEQTARAEAAEQEVERLREAIDAAMDHIDNDETGPAFDVLRAALASTEEPAPTEPEAEP